MSAASLLSKGAIKLFHGAKKDFNSFDSKFATETAFGKGFSFTPEKNVAESYANITPAKLRKLYGKQHIDAAIERKKDGSPILYEVEANVKNSEVLITRKNFEEQDKEVQKKLKRLIEKEGLSLEDLDLTKPKFWRQILNLVDKDADELFTTYGIKAALKDARDSKLKQVGGKIEYTVYDPKVLKIKNKKVLERTKKNKGGEMKVPKLKYAVGSVAQKAAEGSESLLAEARKDVVAARSPEPAVDEATSDMAEAVSKVDAASSLDMQDAEINLQEVTELVDSFSFAGDSKLNKQFVMENLSQISDSPEASTKEGIVDFITSLHRQHVAEEKKPLLAPEDFKKLSAFAKDQVVETEESVEDAETEGLEEFAEGGKAEGNWYDEDVTKYLKFEKEYEKSIDKAKTPEARERIQERFQNIKDSFDQEVIVQAMMKKDRESMAHGGSLLIMKPVDTYDNIRPEEKEAVKASQKPDAEMKKDYTSFIMEKSLDKNEQEHLKEALQKDSELSSIFDKIMDVAGEFSGEGEVKGPGTGTSDSIPARLSDGEFVFTRKATDQIGVNKLQAMMDDAEREADGGKKMQKYFGGIVNNPLQTEKKKDGVMYKEVAEEEIKKQMLQANQAPSLFAKR